MYMMIYLSAKGISRSLPQLLQVNTMKVGVCSGGEEVTVKTNNKVLNNLHNR